ncbi:MAG: hypothetical protein K6T16_00460 [Candidatus Pacearchaeota archaeon]|nr:hypothetical protein [Candidatus Pacearchaeota archaeon]
MKRAFPFLLSFYLAANPFFVFAQESKSESKLEETISREELNEIRRRGAFSKLDVPIIKVRVIDYDSKCPIDDAIVELKEGDKRINDSYPIGRGRFAYFSPYLTKTERSRGIAIFSVARGHEPKLTRIEVTHPEYRAFFADFPLGTLLRHINNPQSSALPDSVARNLKFRYLWDEANVFRVNYNREYRDYEYLQETEEFIDKIVNDEILRYFDNAFGESFYARYIGEGLMYLPTYGDFHILIPIEVELKKVPQKITIER